jgi:very-short-patch-repair endonuclease
VARAVDSAGVLFLPNCLTRVQIGPDKRATREADFLICHNGKWGILEVDGPHHPRAVVDHERDRVFRGHRIKVIERFDWEECYKDAPSVVQQFLTLLDKNG